MQVAFHFNNITISTLNVKIFITNMSLRITGTQTLIKLLLTFVLKIITMYKILLIAFSLGLIFSCQETKEDIQQKYRKSYKTQQEALQVSARIDGTMNQTKYLIGELAKGGFQNPVMIDIMSRFANVETEYREWKQNIQQIPGYGNAVADASKKIISPEKALLIEQESLTAIQGIQKEIQAVYKLADQ